MAYYLTISPNGASLIALGKRTRESRLSREDETMKHTFSACSAITHAHQIHTTFARGSGRIEIGAWSYRQTDGRTCLAGGRSALAQVHQPEPRDSEANEFAHVVHDGCAVGVITRDDREGLEPDALNGRDHRPDRTEVTFTGDPANLPGTFPFSIPSIVTGALRAAALAGTYQDALNITGTALIAISTLVSQANTPDAFRRFYGAEYSYTVEVRHA